MNITSRSFLSDVPHLFTIKKVALLLILVWGIVINANSEQIVTDNYLAPSHQASLTIKNRSSYYLTVKVMKTNGRGLYRIVTISPQSSSTVYFSKSDTFYTKTKATKSYETLYKKSGYFTIQCDNTGYSQSTLEFFVSSGGGTGQGISKAEFESDK